MVGVLLASLIEQKPTLGLDKSEVIECDYRKTKSLAKEKYGTVANLLKNMEKHSHSVSHFLSQKCHIDPLTFKKASAHFIK
jgi:hypothetical protein